MSHEVIVKSMIDAAMVGTSFQSAIRQFINDSISSCTHEFVAGRIAEICAAFKKESKEKETLIYNKEDQELFRKRVNNIINDVSRICREMIGYLIVNTKRTKGVYEYAAVKYEKPEKVVTEDYAVNATGILISRTECSRAHFDTSIHCVKPEPTDIIAYIDFFGEEGSPAREAYFWPSWTAEQFVAKMKANQAVKLEDVAKLILSELKAGEK